MSGGSLHVTSLNQTLMRVKEFFTAVLIGTSIIPVAANAQLSLEKLQIHGYLTQGYADANGLSLNGISKHATADYRVAALLFRYDLTANDHFTIQLRSRRLGTNPLKSIEPAINANWIYYEHKFEGAGVVAKAGIIPAPRGIFNEIRSVGTLLPFYRAPTNLYPEGFEAVDGASLYRSFNLKSAGSFEATAYYGGFDNASATFPATGAAPVTSIARYEKAYGGQAWYNTPISGVRFGVGGVKFTARPSDTTGALPEQKPFTRWYGSMDATFDCAYLRSEYTLLSAGANTGAYYVQTGARIYKSLWINAQNEISDRRSAGRKYRLQRDAALGLSFAPTSGVSLKVERHEARGYVFEKYLNPLKAPGKSGYTILSVSTAF